MNKNLHRQTKFFLYLRWVAAPQWGECNGDKQQTSKSQKTYHNTTSWRGTSPPNLRRCRILPTKERRKSKTATKTNSVKVKNRKKQNCRPGGSGNLAGTPGGSFLFSTGAKKFLTDARCHDGHTWQTGCTQNLCYQPWYYVSIGRS